MRRGDLIRHFIFAAFGLSGMAALIYEVVWTRSLSVIMGSSTYALSTMLAAFMAGLSVGGFLGGKLTEKVKRLEIAFALCELGIGLAGLLTVPLIKALTPMYVASYYKFHFSFNAFSAVQFAIIFLIMGVPTTLMGLAFPIVISFYTKSGESVGRKSGHLYCINTFGAIIGSMTAGFMLIPALGVRGASVAAAALNIFTAAAILILVREFGKLLKAATAVVVFMAFAALIDEPDVPLFSYYSAHRFGSYEEVKKAIADLTNSADFFVWSHEGVEGNVYLTKYNTLINNAKWEAGDERGFSLLAFLPYLSHSMEKPPKIALNIGLGSGQTLLSLSRFPFERIDSVELSEDIIEVNRRFLNPSLFSDPRINHVRADGRNFLLLNRQLYDIIVVSPSWAVESGSAEFLTDEFFALAESRLEKNGVIALWVDYFLMDEDDHEVLLRTFSRHFRHATDWLVAGDNMILVGSSVMFPSSEDEIKRMALSLKPSLGKNFSLAMSEKAVSLLPPGAINTDDRPVIEFHNARNIILGHGGHPIREGISGSEGN